MTGGEQGGGQHRESGEAKLEQAGLGDDPVAATVDPAEQAFADSRNQGVAAASRVHPYIEKSDTGTAAETAVAQASMRLLRAWQPETRMVLYRPKTITTPPAANIRLMPVTEHIVEGLSSESERSQYWFWLSPRGAARLSIAVAAFEQAMLDVERERRGRARS